MPRADPGDGRASPQSCDGTKPVLLRSDPADIGTSLGSVVSDKEVRQPTSLQALREELRASLRRRQQRGNGAADPRDLGTARSGQHGEARHFG
ncbi:hypothetical protein RJ641_009896 [Dillenia turbinata]|uniref:Uncharacterized protein n=1 Tax=Dillenia turbinata TaxID=194707 RepID=A0AAN8V5D9_9MAGN